MNILNSPQELRHWRKAVQDQDEFGKTGKSGASASIGLVPTMGALHAGHVSLIERARKDCDLVIASIFVNPSQFNEPKDLESYPRIVEQDIEKLRMAGGVDALFLPTAADIYPDHYRYEVREKELSLELCGASRPGHFAGMLTVVLKLLNLTRPDRAYFGEKDFQQLSLVRDMAEAFFLTTKIIGCPTVRENDGLAMSSRNLLLTAEQRERAPRLHAALSQAESADEAKARLEGAGFRVDYVADREGRRFAAAFLGEVRLIDNVPI